MSGTRQLSSFYLNGGHSLGRSFQFAELLAITLARLVSSNSKTFWRLPLALSCKFRKQVQLGFEKGSK